MSKKTFETPDKAVAWALSYLHCSNAECVVFTHCKEKIVELYIGSRKNADKLMKLHRNLYVIVTTNGIELNNMTEPFEYGFCLN